MSDDGFFLDAAARIGRRIASQGEWSGEACAWQVAEIRTPAGHEHDVRWRDGGAILYQGAAGIGLFLAELGAVTGDADLIRASHGAFRRAVASASDLLPNAFGFCDGRVGVAYALARAARICGAQEWADAARRMIEPLYGHERTDRRFDVISGAAGAIPALLVLSDWLDLPSARASALDLGAHLLVNARKRAVGFSWSDGKPAFIDDLTGLAHGAAGIGLALLELSVASASHVFRHAAAEAFAYEGHAFDATVQNWPDYFVIALQQATLGAPSDDEARARIAARATSFDWNPTFSSQWCHGAAGIGLTRARAYDITGAPRYAAEMRIGAETTRCTLHQAWNFSLCHGRFGNCETLLAASESLGEPRWRGEVVALAAEAVERYELTRGAWPCGTPTGAPDPSLFVGEAGIGLFLLRLARPDATNVLLVTPPWSVATLAARRESWAAPTGREAWEACRREHVEAHLGLSLRVAAAAGTAPLISIDADDHTPVLTTARELMAAADRDPTGHLADAFRLESALLGLTRERPHRARRYVARLFRTGIADADLRKAVVTLAADVLLVRQRYDWVAWLRTESPVLPASTGAEHCFIAFIGADGLPTFSRLDLARFLLLERLRVPTPVADLLEAGTAEHGLRPNQILETLRQAYGVGFVAIESSERPLMAERA